MGALKKCKCCGLEAHTEEDLKLFRKNKRLKHGRANWCYDCYNDTYRERKKIWNMMSNYGITEEDYNTMLEKQGYKCAICKTSTPNGQHNTWHIDHCHSTGHVRGLLCHSCNTSLGHFKDDIEILENAIEYLKGDLI